MERKENGSRTAAKKSRSKFPESRKDRLRKTANESTKEVSEKAVLKDKAPTKVVSKAASSSTNVVSKAVSSSAKVVSKAASSSTNPVSNAVSSSTNVVSSSSDYSLSKVNGADLPRKKGRIQQNSATKETSKRATRSTVNYSHDSSKDAGNTASNKKTVAVSVPKAEIPKKVVKTDSKENSKKRSSSVDRKTASKKPKLVSDDDDESESDEVEYEVEKILKSRLRKGKREFFIKWKGFGAQENSWEPEENLHCEEKVQVFMAEMDKVDESLPREKKKSKPRAKASMKFDANRATGGRFSTRVANKPRITYRGQ